MPPQENQFLLDGIEDPGDIFFHVFPFVCFGVKFSMLPQELSLWPVFLTYFVWIGKKLCGKEVLAWPPLYTISGYLLAPDMLFGNDFPNSKRGVAGDRLPAPWLTACSRLP